MLFFSSDLPNIIVEAIKSYLSQQRANMAYEGIENAFMELKNIRDGKKSTSSLGTLDDLIDELKHSYIRAVYKRCKKAL